MNRYLPNTGLLAVALLGACGGSRPSSGPVPTDPEAAVRTFLSAVQANNLVAMGEAWGSERGPAVGYMDAERLEQRLTIIQTYLAHESYEIVRGSGPRIGDVPGRRVVEVRLRRRGCMPVVPFTVVRWRDGWLVSQIDLEAAGTPVQRCR